VLVGCAAVFGLVGVHVLLTQGQFRLARLQSRADDEEARYVRLRLEVAGLESPARIVAAAQERLGMVAPSSLTYLTPEAPISFVGAPTTRTASVPAPAPPSHRAGEQTRRWAAVKPALASHP
jgi:cell division protein FtsL